VSELNIDYDWSNGNATTTERWDGIWLGLEQINLYLYQSHGDKGCCISLYHDPAFPRGQKVNQPSWVANMIAEARNHRSVWTLLPFLCQYYAGTEMAPYLQKLHAALLGEQT